MDTTTPLVLLVAAAAIGVIAVVAIMRRSPAADAASPPAERPYAASTEGMQRCPNCGVGNLVTESTCSACGKRLG